MQFPSRVFLCLWILGGAGAIHAADTIDWGTPANISGDSDVVTTGSLLYAYNFGSAGVQSTNVNGVNFVAWEFPPNPSQSYSNTTTKDSVTITESLGWLISSNGLGTVGGNFATMTAAYQRLLSSGGASDFAATLTMSLGGLTPGTEYIFQWWINNSSLEQAFQGGGDMLLTTANVGLDVVNLNANVGTANGNLGQYVTATFTADSTTKMIDFNGTNDSNRPLINAFQLRVVPEPSTWFLGAIATTVLALAARRRNREKA